MDSRLEWPRSSGVNATLITFVLGGIIKNGKCTKEEDELKKGE